VHIFYLYGFFPGELRYILMETNSQGFDSFFVSKKILKFF